MQFQTHAALQARSAVILEDACRVANLRMSREIRVGANQNFKLGGIAQMYLKDEDTKTERWTPGFRIIGPTIHHIVVERGDKISKYHKFKSTVIVGESLTGTGTASNDRMSASSSVWWLQHQLPVLNHGIGLSILGMLPQQTRAILNIWPGITAPAHLRGWVRFILFMVNRGIHWSMLEILGN